jgi:hypothetical protein
MKSFTKTLTKKKISKEKRKENNNNRKRNAGHFIPVQTLGAAHFLWPSRLAAFSSPIFFPFSLPETTRRLLTAPCRCSCCLLPPPHTTVVQRSVNQHRRRRPATAVIYLCTTAFRASRVFPLLLHVTADQRPPSDDVTRRRPSRAIDGLNLQPGPPPSYLLASSLAPH